MPIFARAIVLALLLLISSRAAASATEPPRDYFAPRTPQTQQQLGSNEGRHLQKGIAHLRSGKPHELVYAQGEFHFILGYWPNHPQVLGLIAETFLKMGRPGQMEPYFARAYEMRSDASPVYVVHGIALLRANQVDDAIARLERGVELDSDSVNGHYNLGLALVRVKRYDDANRHAQRAYALGHPLPGLREQLQKAGAWNPGADAELAQPAKTSR